MLLGISTSALTPPLPKWSCNDVKPGMWFYSTMRCLYEDGVMLGDGSGNLFPDRAITRGELVTLLAQIDSDYQSNNSKYEKSCFDDVDVAQYYNQPIAWAKENGIISGVSENLFAPNELTTREQFFKIIANYFQKIEFPTDRIDNIQFIDFDDTSSWAKEAALSCVRSGLIMGFPDGTLQPKGNVTRAQTAQVIYVLHGYVQMKNTSGQGSGGNGSDISSCPPVFPSYYYTSWEEFHSGLVSFPIDELSEIQYLEKRYMPYTLKTTYVSAEEQKNGIFENARRRLSETKILLPYYQDQPFSLDNEYGYSIKLSAAGIGRKPWVSCYTTLDVGFSFMSLDPALVSEANDKGASWLLSVLEPDAMNVDNYKEICDKLVSEGIMSMEDAVVYEKEYSLQDRDVTAMVIDHSLDKNYPSLVIYFVYDDLFVCLTGRPDTVESFLPEFTFIETEIAK